MIIREFRVNRPLRVSKTKTYPTGYKGEIPELTDEDVDRLPSLGVITLVNEFALDPDVKVDKEKQGDSQTSNDEDALKKAESIVEAVKTVLDGAEDETKTPTVAQVSEVAGFKVSLEEIKQALVVLEDDKNNSPD